MALFETVRRVPVPPDIAFQVAADVASYRKFLPLLTRSTVRVPRTVTEKGEAFDAELALTFPKLGLSESFVSRVETDNLARTVRARSSEAPFREIETEWRIREAGTGSEVSIRIDYAFRNPFIQLAASGLMDTAITKVMAAFEARALELSRTLPSQAFPG
jgi:coenzyme Q-binding protein COQ10